MSFIETLDNLALKKSELVERFENLIAPKSDQALEAMAQASRSLTRQNFGRTMRLFAPLIFPTSASIIVGIAVSHAIIQFFALRSMSMKSSLKDSISRMRGSGRSFSLPASIQNL